MIEVIIVGAVVWVVSMILSCILIKRMNKTVDVDVPLEHQQEMDAWYFYICGPYGLIVLLVIYLMRKNKK